MHVDGRREKRSQQKRKKQDYVYDMFLRKMEEGVCVKLSQWEDESQSEGTE